MFFYMAIFSFHICIGIISVCILRTLFRVNKSKMDFGLKNPKKASALFVVQQQKSQDGSGLKSVTYWSSSNARNSRRVWISPTCMASRFEDLDPLSARTVRTASPMGQVSAKTPLWCFAEMFQNAMEHLLHIGTCIHISSSVPLNRHVCYTYRLTHTHIHFSIYIYIYVYFYLYM